MDSNLTGKMFTVEFHAAQSDNGTIMNFDPTHCLYTCTTEMCIAYKRQITTLTNNFSRGLECKLDSRLVVVGGGEVEHAEDVLPA